MTLIINISWLKLHAELSYVVSATQDLVGKGGGPIMDWETLINRVKESLSWA